VLPQLALITVSRGAGGLESVHVPYSFGWSIIALTALVKLATFPFTKIQVRMAGWRNMQLCVHTAGTYLHKIK